MKSNAISKVRDPYGIGVVVRPRAVRYRGTCQEWLTHGVCTRRILPTIWVHRCSVACVSRHSSYANAGQGEWLRCVAELDICASRRPQPPNEIVPLQLRATGPAVPNSKAGRVAARTGPPV